MLKENGMIMLSEVELKDMMAGSNERIAELEQRNRMLRMAIMELMKKGSTDNKDVRVSKMDFLEIYNDALNEMFDSSYDEDNDIYGYDITVHWHGIYCSCGDGATPCNYIIPAIKNCYEEDDEEY